MAEELDDILNEVYEPFWKLNEIGNQLYEILNKNKWFDENEE